MSRARAEETRERTMSRPKAKEQVVLLRSEALWHTTVVVFSLCMRGTIAETSLFQSFSCTLLTLSSMVWTRSVRVPNLMVVVIRGAPIACTTS